MSHLTLYYVLEKQSFVYILTKQKFQTTKKRLVQAQSMYCLLNLDLH